MESVTIIEQDRVDAANFLQQLLTDQVPIGDFRKGNALHDLCVTAISTVFAYLKREVDYVKARQSLLLLASLTGPDVDRAVDEIMANWFLSRNSGKNATGTLTIYLTDNESFTVTTAMRFYRSDGTEFKPNYLTDQAFGPDDMAPVVDSSGVVTSYTLRVLVIAAEEGDVANVAPGAFTDYAPRSSRIIRIENDNQFSGGQDEEDTTTFLSRAETAPSTRNMVSGRSIDVTLREGFAAIDSIVTVGHGDSEMIRDLLDETVTSIRLHVGGHSDSFIKSAVLESQEFTGAIGGVFADPRPGYYVFRDDTVDFNAAGVIRGDVISIKNALLSEPQNYIVDSADEYTLLAPRRSQFPLAMPKVEDSFIDGTVGPTIGNWPFFASGRRRLYAGVEYTFTAADIGKFIRIKDSSAVPTANDGVWEIIGVNGSFDPLGSGTNYATLGGWVIPTFLDESNVAWDLCTRDVKYSVGSAPPSYDNKIAERGTGLFTKLLQTDGRVVLPARPIYKIRDVSFADPTNVTGYAIGGRVTFLTRVNTTPADPGGNPDLLQYQVVCNNYGEAQSGWQVMELVVGWAGAEDLFNDFDLRVTYDTLTSFDDVWAYMVDPDRRQVCASSIPRGAHPIYLSFTVNYKLVRTAIDDLDETAAAQTLVDFVENFSSSEELDVSDLVAVLRSTYDVLGLVDIPSVAYVLYAPDGRNIGFETENTIELDVAKETGIAAYDRLEDLAGQGLSVNTVRYILAAADITFVKL